MLAYLQAIAGVLALIHLEENLRHSMIYRNFGNAHVNPRIMGVIAVRLMIVAVFPIRWKT